ncbi:hypothetical protein Aple_073890 [Acrocarpospora pleiomorpha]|uniref:Uncharacterized protein n=1 Tax=Acrocarpospora pleiomorpha TaxID=90975 RepID=A0A5M3XUC6_9ACTN|nr:hypothetical protein [Acrocarpospora pleiomorpha]GES24490.1 hypothetical protein Aple_073890 [Acrocarpospora pleiomorpha]
MISSLLAAVLPLVLIGLALAARRAEKTRYRRLTRAGAWAGSLTAITYGYSSAMFSALCPEDGSFEWLAEVALYSLVVACVLMAGRSHLRALPHDPGRRSSGPDWMIWLALIVTILPTIVNSTRAGVVWIGAERVPPGLYEFLDREGLVPLLAFVELIVAIGTIAVLVFLSRGRTVTRVTVTSLGIAALVGLIFSPPLVGVIASLTDHLAVVPADISWRTRDPVFARHLRSLLSTPSSEELPSISPLWFSISFAIAGALLLIRDRRLARPLGDHSVLGSSAG